MNAQGKKYQSRNQKRTARTLNYLAMVTEVGEELTTQTLLHRMRHTPIPTKLGHVPDGWIPATTVSLGLKMRRDKRWQMIPKKQSKSYNLWRRVE
tara:strand:- start:3233 stop:3517 length:285 start_codon:yes stop_codon:yes gene_type:complete